MFKKAIMICQSGLTENACHRAARTLEVADCTHRRTPSFGEIFVLGVGHLPARFDVPAARRKACAPRPGVKFKFTGNSRRYFGDLP
jgi:hypothetical protein